MVSDVPLAALSTAEPSNLVLFGMGFGSMVALRVFVDAETRPLVSGNGFGLLQPLLKLSVVSFMVVISIYIITHLAEALADCFPLPGLNMISNLMGPRA